MDTRKKIVEPHGVVRDGRPVALIIGYFDPMYAESTRALRKSCAKDEISVAAVAEPESPLLPWRARAELAAALECVDYVIDAAQADAVQADRTEDLRGGDLERREALVQHVLMKHPTK